MCSCPGPGEACKVRTSSACSSLLSGLHHLSACQAEKLVAKLDALGTTAGDLGLSLFKVAKFEVRARSLLALALPVHVALCCTSCA